MTITDKDAIKELKTARSYELNESIETYPDDERDGRSDMQIIADECSYILSNFDECGHVLYDDLRWARDVIRVTKNGKVIPLWPESLMPRYTKSEIQNARNVINEHRRLKSLMARLNKKGFYGRW